MITLEPSILLKHIKAKIRAKRVFTSNIVIFIKIIAITEFGYLSWLICSNEVERMVNGL